MQPIEVIMPRLEPFHGEPRGAKCTSASKRRNGTEKMSLPKDLRDQLLSAYLDDALSADEQSRVDRLLDSDPDARDELDSLRQLRSSLRDVARSDSDATLGTHFADRVLGAAVAQARSEGLAEDHPLVRLAEQPSTTRAPAASPAWLTGGLLVGLAASIALAVIMVRPQDDSGSRIALAPGGSDVVSPLPEDPPSVMPEVAPRIDLAQQSPGADGQPESVIVEDVPPEVADVRPQVAPSVESIADVEPPAVEVMEPKSVQPESVEPIRESPAPMVAGTDLDERAIGTGSLICVLDVRRTPQGRQNRAVESALRTASIASANRKELAPDVVSSIDPDAVEPVGDEDEVSVIYLHVDGKKFDHLHRVLWQDQQGVESVRIHFSMDKRFTQVADSLRVDPTAVRLEDEVYELYSEQGAVDQLVDQLNRIDFGNKPERGEGSARPVVSGADVPAQAIIVIR